MIKVKNKDLFKKCLVLVMALMLIGTTVFTQFASAEETGEWVEKAKMRINRSSFHSAVINEKLYVLGGESYIVEEYNPLTDKWTTKAPLDRVRMGSQIAVVNKKIYMIGGGKGQDIERYRIDEYDPITDKWTAKAQMPNARSYFKTEVINGKIYAIGSDEYKMDVYDPLTNTWITKSNMLTRRKNFETTVVNQKIYIVGGQDIESGKVLPTVEEYNTVTDTWSSKASMLQSRKEFGLTVLNSKIYAIGGNSGGYLNSVEEYDIETNCWVSKSFMKVERAYPGIEIFDGKIYAIGGTNNHYMTDVEAYNPAINKWETKASTKQYRVHHQVGKLNGKIYALGGYVQGSGNSLELYNIISSNNPTLTVTPSSNKVKVGQEFTTTIGIHNVKNIFAEDIKINYDKERFEYVSAQPKEGIKICNEDKTEEGKLRFVIASLGKGNEATGDKDLIELKFKAKKPGEGKVDIIKGRIADNETLEIDVTDENCGEAIITVEVSADVNRDGSTTLLDLGIDAGYYNMKASDTDTSKHDADVVPNGTIDDEDLIEITGDLLKNKDYVLNNA